MVKRELFISCLAILVIHGFLSQTSILKQYGASSEDNVVSGMSRSEREFFLPHSQAESQREFRDETHISSFNVSSNNETNVQVTSPSVSLADTAGSNATNITTDQLRIIAWTPENYLRIIESPETYSVLVHDLVGVVQKGRLVVNINHTRMFWYDGQTKLCNILKNMTMSESFERPILSDSTAPSPHSISTPLLNVTMDCKDRNLYKELGQGNWVTALYCVRIAAARAKVDFQFQCTDGRESQMNLLLPWFEGFHAAPINQTNNNNSSNPWPYTGTLPTIDEACTSKYPSIRVDKMADQVIKDVRKMAVTLVGSKENQNPLIPNVTLDDVVIHFRCGDVMGGARRNDFGMIKFNEYQKWISREAKSIGILTQPFEAAKNRRKDKGKVDSCRAATYLLVETLNASFSNARITIHNGANETLPLAYGKDFFVF